MILVTGASGFVGQHLVRYLSARGAMVRALYNSREPDAALKALPGVDWKRYDLLDIYDVEEAMQGIDEVYHCAAMVSFEKNDRAWLLHFNTESTANIVNQALDQGIRKLVYVSSVAALGRTASGNLITEEEQWEESRYNSTYARSKHQAEIEVWRGIGEGLNAVIVNPGVILGAGDWQSGSASLMRVVNKEFPFYTEGVTAWVDVEDVVRAMVMLMESDIEAERFILCEGSHSYREVFTFMANALGKKPPHIKANALMAGLVWRWNALKMLLTGKRSTVTKETANTAQRKCYYDNSKLPNYLHDFRYTPLPETIRKMADAFKNSYK